jgi:hypothetical protein
MAVWVARGSSGSLRGIRFSTCATELLRSLKDTYIKKKYMKEIEKAELMLRIKMMEEVKNKVPMEERILFKARTKKQQTLSLEGDKQKKPME